MEFKLAYLSVVGLVIWIIHPKSILSTWVNGKMVFLLGHIYLHD
jgi:hypothetical protein